MASEKVDAEIVICDGCGHQEFHVINDMMPLGYYLDVFLHHSGGGDGRAKIYAHTKRCIVRAIDAAFARRN